MLQVPIAQEEDEKIVEEGEKKSQTSEFGTDFSCFRHANTRFSNLDIATSLPFPKHYFAFLISPPQIRKETFSTAKSSRCFSSRKFPKYEMFS